MTKTTVIDFAKPSDFSPDPLTDLLRAGARELLATAVRAEAIGLCIDIGFREPDPQMLLGLGHIFINFRYYNVILNFFNFYSFFFFYS